MLNGALVIEIFSKSFSESKKNFDCLIKLGTFWLKKNWDMGNEKYVFTRFKYLSYSEVQKNIKVVNV